MDEFEIIAEIFAPLATFPGAFGLKDDAAAIPARPGFDLIVTTDQIAEGIDFFAFDPSAEIAQKALRVNLSDLAAKGAVPEFYLLNLALPQSMTREWLADFANGLAADQARYGISLLGGDTSRGAKFCPSPSPPSDLCRQEGWSSAAARGGRCGLCHRLCRRQRRRARHLPPRKTYAERKPARSPHHPLSLAAAARIVRRSPARSGHGVGGRVRWTGRRPRSCR